METEHSFGPFSLQLRKNAEKFRTSRFPSLHHRKEGWPSDQENIAKPPLTARPGWFSDREQRVKPPRLRLFRWLRDILLMTQPPLLAVMQGGKFSAPPHRDIFFTAP